MQIIWWGSIARLFIFSKYSIKEPAFFLFGKLELFESSTKLPHKTIIENRPSS
jgi:hypothetical protein